MAENIEYRELGNENNTNNQNHIEPVSNIDQNNLNPISIDSNNKIRVKGDDLTPISTLSYSVGHFQNDICASCWFNFMSYYLVHIRQMDKIEAGFVLLAGQVADALSTPVVGVLSDRTETKIGKRTPWYIGGTILVVITFTLIFQSDIVLPKGTSDGVRFMYFIINPSLFNVGWAAVQVSHMSLLPSLSLSKRKQDQMTRMRTGFTFGSQLISLMLSLLFFAVIDDKFLQYSILTLTCIGLGIIASSIFLIYCREVALSQNIKSYYDEIKTSINKRNLSQSSSDTEPDEAEEVQEKNITWRFWIAKPEFYYYMFVYMFVRLAINVSASMIPFYCKNILKWNNENGTTPIEISIFLILSNTGSVCNSLFFEKFYLHYFHKRNHRVALFSFAVIVVLIGCLPLYFLNEHSAIAAYFLAFFFGSGFSMGLSGASSLMNDVVGSNGNKGAFVYGAYSFADKISNGVLLFFMIQFADTNNTVLTIFMSFFPPTAIIISLVCVVLRRMISDKEQAEILKTKKNKKHYGTILDNSILTFV